MKNDTKTFLATVLGIPVALSGAWGVHAADAANEVVYQRDPVVTVQPQAQVPTTTPKKQVPATPVVVKKVPVKTVAKPVTVPVPVPAPAPVVTVVTTQPPVQAAPQPVVSRPSRRTRAS